MPELEVRRSLRPRDCGQAAVLLTLLTLAMVLPPGCGSGSEPAAPPPAARAEAAAEWYASVDGEQVGPFTEFGLRTELVAGRVGDDDLVWKEGMAEWRPASEVLGDETAASAAGTSADGRSFLALVNRAPSVTDDEMMVLYEYIDPTVARKPSATRMRTIFDRHDDLLADARAGMRTVGRLEHDYTQGAYLLLPHLAPGRQLAKLLRLEAVFRSANGEQPLAIENCAAIARIARQVAHDDVALSSLVSMATASLFAQACNEAGIESADADALRDSTAWLRGDDPFRLAAACRVEQTHMVDTMAKAIREGRLAEYAAVIGMGAEAKRDLLLASSSIEREVDQCRAAFDALIRVVESTRRPSQTEMDALLARIDGGDFGSLAKALVPPVARCAAQTNRTLDQIDPVLSRLGL